MKKKIISLLLAVVMIVGMIPMGAMTAFAEETSGSAAEEIFTDVIKFNKSATATSENGHFELMSSLFSLTGWQVDSYSHSETITIRAKDSQYIITRIDAVLCVNLDDAYSDVTFSRGVKEQSEGVVNGSIVTVNDINATEVTISSSSKDACIFRDITVSYKLAEDATECGCLDVGEGAYIDTEITPDKDTRIVMDVELNNQMLALFGCIVNTSPTQDFYVNSGGMGYGSGYGHIGRWANDAPVIGRQRVEFDKNEFKVDGVVKDTFEYVDFQGQSMYLFGIHIDNWVQTFENQFIRFYSCQIYRKGVIIRDYVPAKKDGVVGVYDKLSKSFYAKQGDGVMNAYKSVTPQSTLPSGNEGVILDFSGEITVSENTTINAQPGQSGIVIADGREVTINIEENVTLTVNGGAAVGRYGAGAGIEVPESSSLTVLGEGTLKATGGMAAAGEKGGKGGDGAADYYWTSSGAGGNGGYGGGGAGAGIGGRGGNGGLGGNGGAGVSGESYESTALISGRSGSVGKDGIAGSGCGSVTFSYTVIRDIQGGAASNIPSQGGARGNVGQYTYSRTYLGFDGGGGGAGGNGYKGADIGSGGGGAGGGGGGGSGLIISWYYTSDVNETRGTGHAGVGGYGAEKGNNGWDNGPENNSYGLVAGLGALGGNGAGAGEEKTPEYCYQTAVIPQATEHLVYNGKEQIGVVAGTGYTLTGVTAETDVGHYEAKVKLDTNYIWPDGTFDDKTIKWAIHSKEDEDGDNWCNICGELYLEHNTPTKSTTTLNGGNWHIRGILDLDDVLTVEGNVALYISDNSVLNANKGIIIDGAESSLTIYAQSDGESMGKIIATGSYQQAGIGSGYNGVCGDITINGGNITATGGQFGAGIGSGRYAKCKNITITGGTVTATAGEHGAGIGSGLGGTCGNISISGGNITAIGGGKQAGIGRGLGSSVCGNISISNLIIEAGGNKDDAKKVQTYGAQQYVHIYPCEHEWYDVDGIYHKCDNCGAIESHIDGDGDKICDICKDVICLHEDTTVSYDWNGDHTVCTVTKHCKVCDNDILTESSTNISFVKNDKATDCRYCDQITVSVIFESIGTVELVYDGDRGEHIYEEYVCKYCPVEDLEGAKTDAIKAIDYTADHSDDEAINLLAETAKDAINEFRDEYNTVAEVLKIRDLTVSQINAIKTIIAEAGNSTNRTVKAAVIAAKADISSAENVEDVENIRDEYLAAIEKLTGEVHEHTYSENWSCDPYYHWHDATCVHTGLTSDFAAHTFDEGVVDGNKTTFTCECGYTKIVYDKPDDEGELVTGISYTGISLTLGSDISINFYMELPDEARNNGKMTFNIGGRVVTLSGTDAKYNEKEGKWFFQTPLNALEMAEIVTATFTLGGTDYTEEYSVQDYIAEIVDPANNYDKEAVALAKKIANYGYYAQIYLANIHENVKIVESGEGYDKMTDLWADDISVAAAKEVLANYSVTVSGTSDNLSLYGSTLYFDSATALNYYVTVKNGVEPTANATNTVTGESKQVEIKLYKDNIYIVSVKDILATELGDDITVTINDELTLTGSVLAYCNSVMTKDGQTDAAKNAIASFYEYHKAAVEYAEDTVTFDNDTYCERIYQTVKHGEKVQRPDPDPMTYGFVFDGWYKDEERTIPWNFDTPITEDTTIYGKWISQEDYQKIVENAKFQVSNLRNNAISNIESLNLEDGKKQDFIAEVDKARFEAFSLIENAKYTAEIQNIIAEATNKINEVLSDAEHAVEYTVSFDMMGHGEQVSSQKVKKGEYAELTVPEAEGYFFDGWFKDETLQDKWIFNTDTVNGDITLYADWRKIITVTFDMMGHGTPLGQLNAYEGYTFEAPYEPFDSSFKFEGWYKDLNFTEKWNFDTEIVGDTDITLYAKWVAKQ